MSILIPGTPQEDVDPLGAIVFSYRGSKQKPTRARLGR